jgi:Short C-terminal domain
MLVGGLVGFGVYKMSTHDAQRIEEHTGLPPEDLEDEDLEQAMDELGIPKQLVDDSDQEIGGGQAPAATAAPAGGGTDLADELRKLADLRDQGILTEEEFEAQKAKILGS